MLHRRTFAWAATGVLSLFLASSVALARDRSFAAVLKGLKHDYQVEPQSVPGMWLAKFFIKATPTPGLSDFDIVLFEEQGLPALAATRDLDGKILRLLGKGWSPFIQVDSSADKERVLIFARSSGRHMDLFIFTCEPDEGVAVYMRADPSVVADMLDHPNSPSIPGQSARP